MWFRRRCTLGLSGTLRLVLLIRLYRIVLRLVMRVHFVWSLCLSWSSRSVQALGFIRALRFIGARGFLRAGGLVRVAGFRWASGFLRADGLLRIAGFLRAGRLVRIAGFRWADGLLRMAGFLKASGLAGPMLHIRPLGVVRWLRVPPPITPTAVARVLAVRTT
jgi:hypothetical protein